MVAVFTQFLAADCDEVVDVEGLPINIRRPKKVLLLFFKIGHHLRLCLWQVGEVLIDIGTRAALPLCLSTLTRRSLNLRRRKLLILV